MKDSSVLSAGDVIFSRRHVRKLVQSIGRIRRQRGRRRRGSRHVIKEGTRRRDALLSFPPINRFAFSGGVKFRRLYKLDCREIALAVFKDVSRSADLLSRACPWKLARFVARLSSVYLSLPHSLILLFSSFLSLSLSRHGGKYNYFNTSTRALGRRNLFTVMILFQSPGARMRLGNLDKSTSAERPECMRVVAV